ncbi:uncharacterized protein EKO05_0008327 [Ascochyta rabiei]|uniref:Uncharacterized protein n=1 Tax=Didymella rabiei TaxID=5454 RepID=A0A163DDN5_DIDRA|nr:uncharacterized protein EKO05_0008327 [Ascochyta rabiei]KZM23096.1 hypothetical protein ST47_g5720 [Ascochyta rabiei]UPX18003.1 hypothetical protein EKO05_0008327 [Ascochyta rabiei]
MILEVGPEAQHRTAVFTNPFGDDLTRANSLAGGPITISLSHSGQSFGRKAFNMIRIMLTVMNLEVFLT